MSDRGAGLHPVRRFISRNLRGELWLIPAAFVLGSLALANMAVTLEDEVARNGHTALVFEGTAATGQQVLATIATAVLSLAALVFSISMVVLQLTSQQFSPRALRLFNRDPRTQVVLGVFVATFLYSLLALGSLGDDVNAEVSADRLTVTLGIALAILSLGAFIYHMHHISESIRVAHIIESIASETRGCIVLNFPRRRPDLPEPHAPPAGPPDHEILFERRSGVMTTVWFSELAELARRYDCVIRLVPEVGEYVAHDRPLCEVWGATAPPVGRVLRLVEIEIERTVELDVAFGFRQLVDIAEKALSPAVNDPTTAVQVIDRLSDLLERLIPREFPRGVVSDHEGVARVFYEPINWEALVHLTFDELRDYGAGSRQVVRRLRASLQLLIELADDDRRPPLVHQLEQLDLAVLREFPTEDDHIELFIADDLGLGGER